tara:strand:+ start:27 stop:464 length:438 start_codon:yes stop_codon:yes gene_type:complete
MFKKKCIQIKNKNKCVKKKYVQKKDKKKICPKCNGFVFNATRTCKLISNDIVCGHKFISLRQVKLLNENLKKNLVKIKIPNINNIYLNEINKLRNDLMTLNQDIIILNKLAEKYDMRCLSPYKIKKDSKMFSYSKNIVKNLNFNK